MVSYLTKILNNSLYYIHSTQTMLHHFALEIPSHVRLSTLYPSMPTLDYNVQCISLLSEKQLLSDSCSLLSRSMQKLAS